VPGNNKTKQETFMKMVSAGGGLGMGVKDYDVVFIFETEKALTEFLDSGWSGSGQADAAAKAGEKGGAYSGAMEVAPGVWVLPNHQKRFSPAVDAARYEVLQERRPE
jgi:lipid-binding SYLF domain-containing protein